MNGLNVTILANTDTVFTTNGLNFKMINRDKQYLITVIALGVFSA